MKRMPGELFIVRHGWSLWNDHSITFSSPIGEFTELGSLALVLAGPQCLDVEDAKRYSDYGCWWFVMVNIDGNPMLGWVVDPALESR